MINLANIGDSRIPIPASSSIIVAATLSLEPFHMMPTNGTIACFHILSPN